VPTLVFRGAESDLLLAPTATEMSQRGPRARIVEFSGIGHAPALMAEDQIAAIESWLAAQP
jgi:pimeloyl-ACP methyl ester carboxylesterase